MISWSLLLFFKTLPSALTLWMSKSINVKYNTNHGSNQTNKVKTQGEVNLHEMKYNMPAAKVLSNLSKEE